MFTKISQQTHAKSQKPTASGQVTLHPQNTLATMQRQAVAQMEEVVPEEEVSMKQDPAQLEGEEEEEMMMKQDPAQLEGEEEEEMMMKQDPAQLEGEEEEEMMMKPGPGQKKEQTGTGNSSRSSKSIPGSLQKQAEHVLGTDLSGVKMYEGAQAQEMGALAFAQDNEITFAPGKFDPQSQSGKELIGHELAHIKQKQEGRVQATRQMKGIPVNDDPSLEKEADDFGKKIADSSQASRVASSPISKKKT